MEKGKLVHCKPVTHGRASLQSPQRARDAYRDPELITSFLSMPIPIAIDQRHTNRLGRDAQLCVSTVR